MIDFLAEIGRWFINGWKAFGYWRAARAVGDREEASGWLFEWVARLALGICFLALIAAVIWVDYYFTTR